MDNIIVWEAFKAYIRGEFISVEAYQKKTRAKIRQKMIQKIRGIGYIA